MANDAIVNVFYERTDFLAGKNIGLHESFDNVNIAIAYCFCILYSIHEIECVTFICSWKHLVENFRNLKRGLAKDGIGVGCRSDCSLESPDLFM